MLWEQRKRNFKKLSRWERFFKKEIHDTEVYRTEDAATGNKGRQRISRRHKQEAAEQRTIRVCVGVARGRREKPSDPEGLFCQAPEVGLCSAWEANVKPEAHDPAGSGLRH